ncbi:MAG TPA: farnesyl diphosphate synthase [Casimicrobiaceae bacterium]|nr:farnesyl diphosphate synthase [Casimicrobiaceae bacterium]
MTGNATFADWAAAHRVRIEHALERALPAAPSDAPRLVEAMRYATLGGGKRVRALLAYAAGEFAGATPVDVDAAAAAVELIHAYSLVHDDLPSMDDDTMRRGRPTCHVAFGEATALLAGDALQARAFEVLAGARLRDAAGACLLLARASGAAGMAAGQAIDLDATGQALDERGLATMHRLKTGALIAAAVRLGAASGPALASDDERALDAYAASAGLAFQVIDDVLDVSATSAALGKTAGKDAARSKPTYVSLLGVEAARAKAYQLAGQARLALAARPAARRLLEIADDIVRRTR